MSKHAVIFWVFWLLSASALEATDLTKVDRAIAKEPKYQSQAPKYCLLVLGPEAKTRIWLVQDGGTLYVDRNGNGDLTEAGEEVKATKGDGTDAEAGVYEFQAGEIREGRLVHRQLRVAVMDITPQAANYPLIKAYLAKHPGSRGHFVGLEVEQPGRTGEGLGGRLVQYANILDLNGVLRFGDSPQDAPILHFRGHWQIGLSEPQMLMAGRERDFTVTIGTPGLGAGSLVLTGYEKLIPEDAHPQLEIEFPPEKPGASPVREVYEIKERC
jgi:hypothetical protein